MVLIICAQNPHLSSHRDFPKPDLSPILAPSQFKNEQKLPKMVYIIPNFLVLHFGESFMKIRTKIAKLQIHENLHKNVNEKMFSFTSLCKFYEFYEGQLKQQIFYSFILLILIYLKWQSSINFSQS